MDPVIEAGQRHRIKHGWIDGEAVLPGKRGFLYLDAGEWRWALMVDGPLPKWTVKLKNILLSDERLRCLVEGEEEAIFAFDEADLPGVAKLARCRFRKVLSEAQREVLRRGRQKSPLFLPSSSEKGGLPADTASGSSGHG